MRIKANSKPKANDKGKENKAFFSKPGRVYKAMGLQYFAKRNETKRNGTLRNGTLRNGTLRNGTLRNGTLRNGTLRNSTLRNGSKIRNIVKVTLRE